MKRNLTALLAIVILLAGCARHTSAPTLPPETEIPMRQTEAVETVSDVAGFYVDRKTLDTEGWLYCIALREDGTGVVSIQDAIQVEWADDMIRPLAGDPYRFQLSGDKLTVPEYYWEFTRSDALLETYPEWRDYLEYGALPDFMLEWQMLGGGLAYSDLEAHLQILAETDSICGVIYIGCVPSDSPGFRQDPGALEQLLWESQYPQMYDFLLCITPDRIIETPGGQEVYCIYPLDADASITVSEYGFDEDGMGSAGNLLFASAYGEPIILRCNVSDIMPSSQVTITDSRGRVLTWEPSLSLKDGSVNTPSAAPFVFDATYYPEEAVG